MPHFIQENKNKHARRAIAKENSVGFIWVYSTIKKLSEKSKNIMSKPINEKNDMIRLAAFNKIVRDKKVYVLIFPDTSYKYTKQFENYFKTHKSWA